VTSISTEKKAASSLNLMKTFEIVTKKYFKNEDIKQKIN
jgi:hypothetical protein